MTRPTAHAYRRSLEDRLRTAAEESGRDLGWLRRRHVFLRLLHRMVATQPDMWVLKGGFAVELRRPGVARATRDLDFALRDRQIDATDGEAVRDLLTSALRPDVDGDQFEFVLGPGKRLRDDAHGRPAWRFQVTARLAGKTFVELTADVVARAEELIGLTTAHLPVGTASPMGAVAREVTVTDLRQQFAEKLHALTRSYASGTATRVKDLLDLVLLIEDGLVADSALVRVVRTVFTVRGTTELPVDLGSPPVAWRTPYATLADEVGLDVRDVARAHDLVAAIWRRALEESGLGEET